jgi:hypothetical protein
MLYPLTHILVTKKSEKKHLLEDPQGFSSWETTLRHVETGYRNAQDIIKFLDAKAGAVAGFALVGIGLVLQVVKEFFEAKPEEKEPILAMFAQYSFPFLAVAISAIVSLVAGVISIWCVVRCITARPPKDIGLSLKHTFLFPFCEDEKTAKEYYKRIHDGLTAKEIAAEYEEQILQVGLIKCKKIKWIRRAANYFLVQLTFLVAGTSVFIVQVLTFPRCPVFWD